MKIAIATHPEKTSSSKVTEQLQFEKLWARVKKKKKANEKLQLSLAELSVVYQEKILPAEKQLASPYLHLILKLLDFFKRKSLSEWQRQELGIWIVENIEAITPLDQEKSRELAKQYYQALANHLDIDVDEVHAEMEQAHRFDEDGFLDDREDIFNEDDERHTPESADVHEDLFGFDEDEPASAQESRIEKLKASEGDKWLKTLFRRTANALHPDKEQDEARKTDKQQLMAALLAARESNDIYTMISLYTEHVDASDLLVDQDVIETVCLQLEQQLHDMEIAHYQLLDSNPLFSVLYNRIYHSNKKTQARNIDQYLERINEQAEDLADLIHGIRNLGDLKEILKYRFEQSRYGDEWPDIY